MTAGLGFPQTLNPSPREVLNLERSLLPAEIAIVLSAARQAVSGKTIPATDVIGIGSACLRSLTAGSRSN
jgi:hypothetical protein